MLEADPAFEGDAGPDVSEPPLRAARAHADEHTARARPAALHAVVLARTDAGSSRVYGAAMSLRRAAAVPGSEIPLMLNVHLCRRGGRYKSRRRRLWSPAGGRGAVPR